MKKLYSKVMVGLLVLLSVSYIVQPPLLFAVNFCSAVAGVLFFWLADLEFPNDQTSCVLTTFFAYSAYTFIITLSLSIDIGRLFLAEPFGPFFSGLSGI